METLFCIVPPHILYEIAKRGTEKQKFWALRTLSASEQFSGRREALSFSAFAAAVPAGEKQRTVYDAVSSTLLPGKKVRQEGQKKTRDAAVVSVCSVQLPCLP